MYADLSGKTAIVTGASKGIGKGIAERFGKEGMNVVVNYRSDPEGAEDTAKTIRANGGNALVLEADVATEEDARQLVEAAVGEFGSLDVLVNNAGFSEGQPSEQLDLENWRRVLDVNLTGAFLVTQAALRVMAGQPEKGCILNISSVHQTIPKVENAHYAASKGGLHMMTKTLALEYAEQGIRINAIAPGTIQTPGNPTDEQSEEEKEQTLSKIPMRKVGEPAQIAAAAAWLVSSEADYVTGATLFVDGGMTLFPSQLS